MNLDLPSLGILVVVELGVVAFTAIATWQYARYHFGRRRPPSLDVPSGERRLEEVESALDNVVREVEQLGESQDFVQELLTKRLNRLGLRPHATQPPVTPAREHTPV